MYRRIHRLFAWRFPSGHPNYPENLQLQTVEDAKRKDRIEVKLQCLTCSGQVTLKDAQREISEDWEVTNHRYARVKCMRHKRED